jgi:hypothetical protein
MHQSSLTSVVDTVICVTSWRRTIKAIFPVLQEGPPAKRLEMTASSVGVATVFPCDRAVRIDVRSALVVGDLGGLGGLSSSHRKTNSLVRLLSISTGKEAEGQTHVMQVEPVERDSDQPSTDNVPDQGSQDIPTSVATTRSVSDLESRTSLVGSGGLTSRCRRPPRDSCSTSYPGG